MATNARLEELKKKFDENPRRYFAPLANEYRKQGDLAQAITLCRAHLPNQPGHVSGHIVLGQALFEARELPESRQVFEQALELDPENLIALRTLGDIANLQGDALSARSWYERVLEADPRNDEITGLLREIAAQASAAPEPPTSDSDAGSTEAPEDLNESDAQVEPPAVVSADEGVPRWDPDKTPVANIAIPERDAEPGFASSLELPPAHDSSDIFGDGVVDQGAELLDDLEPRVYPEPEFVVTSEAPSSEAAGSPEAAGVEAGAPELSSEQEDPQGVAFSAEEEQSQEFYVDLYAGSELAEAPSGVGTAEVFAADLAISSPDSVVVDVQHSGGSEEDRELELEAPVESEVGRFEEDASAFTVAQHLSDPEAHPARYSDDWFNAPTPPRGFRQIPEPEFQAAESTPQETFVIPTPATDSEASSTTVDRNTFDLIENGRAIDAASAESGSAPAMEFESTSTMEFETESVSEYGGTPSTQFDSAATMEFESSGTDVREPPHVELEAEPEPVEIDRGSIGMTEVSETMEDGFAGVGASAVTDHTIEHAVQDTSTSDSTMPEMFVTETMAELYLQQGFFEEALQVYRKLLERNPRDEEIRSRIESLESGTPSAVAEAASAAHAVDRAGQSVRNFFGRIARRQPTRRKPQQSALDVTSLGAQLANRQGSGEAAGETGASAGLSELFASAKRQDDDDAAAQRLASAFGPSEAAGRPTRAADSELSLDHLFRDVPPESSSAVTLDAFFAASGGDASEASGSADQAEGEERTGDIEQFTAWLEGLKKK
jgi:cytochrome c-type biogenesis protein CcmH/NrfG